MRTGQKNRRIELQAPQRVSDGMGGLTTAFVTKYTVWASIEPLAGYEKIAAMQLQSVSTHNVVIDYIRTLRASWRIKYGSRIFDIVNMSNPNEDRRTIVMSCKEA